MDDVDFFQFLDSLEATDTLVLWGFYCCGIGVTNVLGHALHLMTWLLLPFAFLFPHNLFLLFFFPSSPAARPPAHTHTNSVSPSLIHTSFFSLLSCRLRQAGSPYKAARTIARVSDWEAARAPAALLTWGGGSLRNQTGGGVGDGGTEGSRECRVEQEQRPRMC